MAAAFGGISDVFAQDQSVSSFELTLTDVAAGDLVLVFVARYSLWQLQSVTVAGVAASPIKAVEANSYGLAVWGLIAPAAVSSATIVVTFSGSSSYPEGVAVRYSGMPGITLLDSACNTANCDTRTSAATTRTALEVDGAPDRTLLIAAGWDENDLRTHTAANGYTRRVGSGISYTFLLDRFAEDDAGPFGGSENFSTTTSDSYASMLLAFNALPQALIGWTQGVGTNPAPGVRVVGDSVTFEVSAGTGESPAPTPQAGGRVTLPIAAGTGMADPVNTFTLPSVRGRGLSPAPSVTALYQAWIQSPAYAPTGRLLAWHDIDAIQGDAVVHYVADVIYGGNAARVPISSWQCTHRTGVLSYLQCAVPAVEDYVPALLAAQESSGSFRISQRTEMPDGSASEYPMASAPLQQARLARGPTNYTATLIGYSPADPWGVETRQLRDVRSLFVEREQIRMRAAIDWALRPGHTAVGAGQSIVVNWVSYYVGGQGQFMDVGG
jgi:hypothetical protein